MSPIRPLDVHTLKKKFDGAQPFRHIHIQDFLEADFVREVADSFPSYEQTLAMGFGFRKVNENLKACLTEYDKFPGPVQRLADALGTPEFVEALRTITGIPTLLWDPQLAGAGAHVTASSGNLDVHVDFNHLDGRGLFRRLNILIYLNPIWDISWGGAVELWDRDVKKCHLRLPPLLNHCLIFETSEISFHGVTAVTSPKGIERRSFAAYYYTPEPPADWNGTFHSTIFKPRPEEHLKKYVLMPGEKAQHALLQGARSVKRRVMDRLRPKS